MNTIPLPPSCDRATAKALYTDICEALGPAPLTVDASGVKKIGQAMLQVLVAANASDGGIVITQPSPAFRDAVSLAGLAPLLTEPGA